MERDEYARMYALEDHYWWFVGRRRLALGLVDRYAASVPQRRILDFGCGTGVVLGQLESTSGIAVGLDASSEALRFCRQRGLHRLVLGDGMVLPIRSGSVDAVVGLDVFEHLLDDQAAFGEVHRILTPGGVLVLSVPAFRSLWGPHDIALKHFRRYRRPEAEAKLRASGFEIVHSSYAVFYLFPLVLLSRVIEKLRPGPPHASLPRVPEWLNRWLISLQTGEGRKIISGGRFAWGSSVIIVARRSSQQGLTD